MMNHPFWLLVYLSLGLIMPRVLEDYNDAPSAFCLDVPTAQVPLRSSDPLCRSQAVMFYLGDR